MSRYFPPSIMGLPVVVAMLMVASLPSTGVAQVSERSATEWDRLLLEYDTERRAKLRSNSKPLPPGKESPPLDRAAWTRRFLRFADEHRGTTHELKALRWCLVEGLPPAAPDLYPRLEAAFENDPSAVDLSEILGRIRTDEARAVLTRWSESSALISVRAHAGLALARDLRRRLDDAVFAQWDPARVASRMTEQEFQRIDRQITAWFEQALATFREVPTWNGPLGPILDQEHHFHLHLAPGRLAPETKGKDSADQPIALSEAKGRVVLLEFYGHW